MSAVVYSGQARVQVSHTHTDGCHTTTATVTVDRQVITLLFVLPLEMPAFLSLISLLSLLSLLFFLPHHPSIPLQLHRELLQEGLAESWQWGGRLHYVACALRCLLLTSSLPPPPPPLPHQSPHHAVHIVPPYPQNSLHHRQYQSCHHSPHHQCSAHSPTWVDVQVEAGFSQDRYHHQQPGYEE